MDNTKDKSKKIVKLSVGGVYYEVSRSLIESFPDTMLARLISDTWQDDPEKIIFICRDGENFRHILTYMRDKQVHLPINVSKAAMLKDLEYFGFQNVSPGVISEGRTLLAAAMEIKDAKNRHACLLIADHCFQAYYRDLNADFPFTFTFSAHKISGLPDEFKPFRDSDEKLLGHCLAKYGLKQARNAHYDFGGDRWTITLDRIIF